MHRVILFSIVIYFVTSSDSGSLVLDIMAANGLPEPPIVQRVFWACSEGATASVLLGFGGEVGLKALRSVSLICGLPYTFCLFWFCQSLLYVCYEEAGDLDKDRPDMRSFSATSTVPSAASANSHSALLASTALATTFLRRMSSGG